MRRTLFAATIAMAALRGQSVESKTAEQVYKNIVQLKGTPADQLLPAMQFISASLGVECSFCHVQGKMDLDEKPAKKTAREMMAMAAAINKDNFKGQRQVTCYSCHHGVSHPSNMPPVLESDVSEAKTPAPAGTGPTADEIVQRYVTALGGADAMRKTTSRAMQGTILAGGKETPIEVLTKAPNRRVTITHSSNGDSYTAFDGAAGWMGSTGRPARTMSPLESEASSLDAEFYLALRLKEMFPQVRRGRPEEIGGVPCDTLIASKPGSAPVRLYFDSNSGLLLRMIRYGETPLGRNPTQIDYADYREVNGVKIPFRWTLARPNGRFTIQIKDVKANAEIDDGRFAKPAADVK